MEKYKCLHRFWLFKLSTETNFWKHQNDQARRRQVDVTQSILKNWFPDKPLIHLPPGLWITAAALWWCTIVASGIKIDAVMQSLPNRYIHTFVEGKWKSNLPVNCGLSVFGLWRISFHSAVNSGILKNNNSNTNYEWNNIVLRSHHPHSCPSGAFGPHRVKAAWYLLNFMHDFEKNQLPNGFNWLFQRIANVHNRLTRLSSARGLHTQKFNTTTHGLSSLRYSGTKRWPCLQ